MTVVEVKETVDNVIKVDIEETVGNETGESVVDAGSRHVIMKYVSLAVLVIQATLHVILLRYSRTSSSEHYLASTAVLVSECLKLAVCLIVLLYEQRWSVTAFGHVVRNDLLGQPREVLKLLVPAGLYVIQNNLLFFALTNLDAATYQVTYQLKILTTALFSVVLLRKALSSVQWGALLVLFSGVALVQMPDSSVPPSTEISTSGQLVGLVAVLCACMSSGFAGVYFEKLLKGSRQSLWVRNVHMAALSILTASVGVYVNDRELIQEKGFFHGYNKLVCVVVGMQAFGGLVVALVMKYADNILKGFATSISIILSSVLSYVILDDLTQSRYFIWGAALVIVATFMYGSNWGARKDTK